MIALAAGALAVGYLIYKGSGSSGDKADDKESVADDRSERNAPAQDAPAPVEENKEDEELENAYFLEEADGPAQHKKIIHCYKVSEAKWFDMNDTFFGGQRRDSDLDE